MDSLPFPWEAEAGVPRRGRARTAGEARRGRGSFPQQRAHRCLVAGSPQHAADPPSCSREPFHHQISLVPTFLLQKCHRGKAPVPLPQCDGRGHQAGGWHGLSWHPGSAAEPQKTRGPWTHGDKRGGHGSPVRPSSWGPGTPWSNMASKVALTVRCTNATQDAEATMLPLPGHGINATRHRNKTHMEVTAASVTAHPPLAGLAWHALLLGVFSSFA